MQLLYVDDDRINLLLFENACAGVPGVQLITAADGAEALELARTLAPQRLVIDLHLPDLDGPALLQALRREAGLSGVPRLPVQRRRRAAAAPSRRRRRLRRLLDQAGRQPAPAARTGSLRPGADSLKRR